MNNRIRRDGKVCPKPSGEYSIDYGLYGECADCGYHNQCRLEHEQAARMFKKNPLGVYWPRYLNIPTTLFTAKNPEGKSLKPIHLLIITLVMYRHQGLGGHSHDKNVTMAKAIGVSESYVKRLIDELVKWLFLDRRSETPPPTRNRSGVLQYRTSRELSLSKKTLRLINSQREEKDKILTIVSPMKT